MQRAGSGYVMSLGLVGHSFDLLGHNRHLDLNGTRKTSPECAPCSVLLLLLLLRAFVGV